MPNTKTKKFDWQIFLAVFCILLVICCATVCCVVSNTDKGVARAEDAPVTNLTNLTFETSNNFYIKNLSGATTEEIETYIKYFTNGIEGVLSDSVDFSYKLEVGSYDLTYNSSEYIIGNLYFEVNQISSFGVFALSCYIESDSSSRSMFDIMYMYTSTPKTFEFTAFQSTSADNLKYTYNVPTLNSLDWFAVFGISNVISLNRIKFNFNYTTNLGCIISPNDTFATVPSIGAYDEGYQDAVNELQPIIDELRQNNTELQQNNTALQAELNRYKSAYDSIGWFDVLSSSLNNVSLIDIDGYKSTYVDVKVSDGVDNLVNVWNLDENPGNGTAFAVVLPRYYGKGTRFRFIYRALTGSVGGMQNVSASLGYINSTGNLITIMQLPSSVDSYVEFNISEELNTFVIYTTGNLIVFADFKFQVFSFDEIGIYDDGFADGRDEGIKFGEKVGYENGYSDARDKYINNDYSFFALFSSVLDAPLQMIIGTDDKPGMLNFYIPGLDINIAPFLLSLFSVALVITIIRFILARAS